MGTCTGMKRTSVESSRTEARARSKLAFSRSILLMATKRGKPKVSQ